MKIKEWIAWGLVVCFVTASRSLGADAPAPVMKDMFAPMEKAVKATHDSIHEVSKTYKFQWSELEAFQSKLWHAMALDPSFPGVPPEEVPEELMSANLNTELTERFTKIKGSKIPSDLKIEAEFNDYSKVVEEIMVLRNARKFPLARNIAKRGRLDKTYRSIMDKVSAAESPSDENNPLLTPLSDLEFAFKNLKENVTNHELSKKDIFSKHNRFIWFVVALICGFIFGIVGYRMNPEFFQKLIDYFDSNAPTATTHGAKAQKLDYARWLRDFEEILSRLKSSQLVHERRIEDLVKNSDKLTHLISPLLKDPEIRKMLLTHHHQGQLLQAGGRVQINSALEHTLKLCDAVETETIDVDREKLTQLTQTRTA